MRALPLCSVWSLGLVGCLEGPGLTQGELDSALAELQAQIDAQQAAVDAEVASLQSQIDELLAENAALRDDLTAVEALLSPIRLVDGEYGPTVLFEGVNVQIVSGVGVTEGLNGLGNLVVGYAEGEENDTIGSHNIILGVQNSYSGYGGFLQGSHNTCLGAYCFFGANQNSRIEGDYSAAIAGGGYTGSGTKGGSTIYANNSAVLSGTGHTISEYSGGAIIGGWYSSILPGAAGVIVSGTGNTITAVPSGSANHQAVVGGAGGVATYDYSVVVGGFSLQTDANGDVALP